MAVATTTTNRRRAEQAATIGLMLLKATIRGLDGEAAPAETTRTPALAGGAAARVEEAA